MHPEIISDKNQSVKGDMRIGLRLDDYRCQSSRLSAGTAIGGGARLTTDNSSSSNVVASELQWRHKKLSNHHHQRQRQQFVADLKRSKELHLLKLNCCTTTAAATAAALVRSANTSKRMNKPIDSSELIDLELARLNNLKLSDDHLKYDCNNSQQQQPQQPQAQQATSIGDQHTDYYQSATMIIPSSTNNNNNQPEQQQQQHKQSVTQQAEPMETTGAPAPGERPLIVTSALRGASAGLDHQHDHHHDHDHHQVHLNRHRHHDHNIDQHVPHGQHEQYQHQSGAQHFALNNNYTYHHHHLSSASNQLSANNYYFNSQDHQQQQQQVQRNYHNAQDQDQDQYHDQQQQQSEVRLSLNDNFDQTNDDHDDGDDDEEADANQMISYERIDSFAVDQQHQQQQQQHVDYVDLDDIKVVNKHQHSNLHFHQVQLVDRNKTPSPAYLPESVIRFNSQVAAATSAAAAATQQPTIVSANLDTSGQYSRGHFAHDNGQRSAAHGQQSQYYNSSGSSGVGGGGGGSSHNAVNRIVSPTAHRGQLGDAERCRNHAPANQLTALNSVVPSSSLSVSSSSVRATIGLHSDNKQQPLEAQHYHQFASSSLNSTYSNNNNNNNDDDNDLGISTIHHHQQHHHHRDRHRHHHHHAQYNNADDLNESYDKSGQRSAAAAAGTSSNHNGPRQQLVAFDVSHEALIGAHDDDNDDEGQLSRAGAGPEVSYARQQYHATRLDNVISGNRHDEDQLNQQNGGGEPMDEFKVCEWYDCGNTFLDMDEFVRHLEVAHVNQEAREKNRYFCLWANCKRNNQEFNARYKLLIHMRVHSGEKPYSCESNNCKKSFSRLENLKIHVRSHTGEKPYKCNYDNCSKSFTNSSDRIKHHKTHKDPKPYNCTHDGCMKRYTDPSSLRKHLRAHKRYYDSSSTDVTTIITPGSSRFDYIANNSSQTADHQQQQLHLNSSYTSMTSDHQQPEQQQQQYHDLSQPQVNDIVLSSSSASVSYHNHTHHHDVHDSHLTTDYDPTKEFESILGVASDNNNNNQYSHSSARYSNSSMNLASYDDHYNQSSGETRQFLDLDQQQQQQRQQGDTSKTFQADTFQPGRVVCQSGRAFGQVSQQRQPTTTSNNKINSLKMNAIRHEQLSRSWCAGGSPFSSSSSSRLLSPSSRFKPNVRSERQLTVSNAYSYQDGASNNNNPAAECKPFTANSGQQQQQQQHWIQVGNVSAGSSNQLSSSNLNNNNQLQQQQQQQQQTSDSNWQQQQQQQQRPVRVQQQHEQLMRSMPAGPLNGRLTDRLHLSGDNLNYLRTTTNSNAYADNLRDYRQSNFWSAEANNNSNNNNNHF